jgi:hypothetical protein
VPFQQDPTDLRNGAFDDRHQLARGVEEHSKSDSGVSVVMRKYTRDCGPVTVEFNISGFKEVKLKESRVGAGV